MMILITLLNAPANKSIFLTLCPQLMPAKERYVGYQDEMINAIRTHKFKQAALMADQITLLEINPEDSPEQNFLLPYYFLILGKYSALTTMISTSYDRRTNSYYDHYIKAEAWLGLREYFKARNEFVIARSLAAEQVCVLFGLMKANIAVGNKVEAKQLLTKLHSKASARWIDAFLALVDLKRGDEVSAKTIAEEFVIIMSDPLDECEAIPNLDFVSNYLDNSGFKNEARLVAKACLRIKEK
ncbi:MAG TPA: hypothetical protein V6C89_18310 [Drouetiella sp.]